MIDHAMQRFYSVVRQSVADVTGIKVAWARAQTQMSYPWVSLQVIIGPNTDQQQRSEAQRHSIEVTVLPGAVDDLVAVMVSGRYLAVAHTGDPDTTATALAAKAPPHWTAVVAGPVVTLTGSDVFGAYAYESTEIAATPVGDPIWVNQHRRDCTVQVDVWTRLDRDGRPARWDPAGCDTMALRIRDALWDMVPDPWRVYMLPSESMRPFSESYPDGREYLRASFDVVVSWLDVVPERQFGAEVGPMDEAAGTISTSADGLAFVIEDFEIDESLDP